ncbi:hypothetical protein [Kineothrix sp. MB12-C1]|uniref:hypothetical protein n=1 Tax=Kineothrix sp. MB12-C1 TaxID=3070215 RepID=UPI0027D348FC|nr:hypothetical protein [Kineothrix sp. MB12-C1]WMC93156.1 hypothetical protein RBB56_02385 [Kineothrix sp. MB12-C1]
MLKYCPKCKEEHKPPLYGYFPFIKDNTRMCEEHNLIMQDTGLTDEECRIIIFTSVDISFLEAMIALKEKDPIEFQLKMSQFKASLSQQTKTKEEKRTNQVICPFCSSDNTSRISGISKAASVAMLGVYAIVERNRQWHCNNCHSDF